MSDENLAKTETEITKATPLAPPAEVIAMPQLMQQAIALGKDGVEMLERLTTLDERWEKRRAAKEFAAAMAAFQDECPPILQGRKVDYTNTKGQRVKYSYAKIQDIIAIVRPVGLKHGLSFNWDDSDATATHVMETCRVKHSSGHSSVGKSTMPIASTFGMGPQQSYVMASTYAQRESLAKAFGVITTDVDEAAGAPPEFITLEQAAEIAELITRSGRPEANVLKWQGVAAIEEIHLSKYDEVVAMLNKAIKQKEKSE